MNKYMNIALKEALKSYKKGDVPVGAVIVKDGKIISKARNQKHKKNISTKHAEMIAIEKASKKLKNWYLEDCEIYITLEPCIMCYGAILESRISKIIYSCKSEKYGFSNSIENLNKKLKIESGLYEKESQKMLKSFFEFKRK